MTYLFYELQRTYGISERIHELTPVILVANEVPAPDEIDDAWLIEHDWILRRAILDDSFRPALEYLTKSFVGAEVNIRILEANASAQKAAGRPGQPADPDPGRGAREQRAAASRTRSQGLAGNQQQQGMFNTVKRIFDPIGITGGRRHAARVDAAQTMVDYAQADAGPRRARAARLLAQLEVAATALQAAVDKLSAAVKEHYDRVAEIDRLRVHVKENILYYMQAIWSQEPPDQRFFRLYNIDVPIVDAEHHRRPVVDRSATASVGRRVFEALREQGRRSRRSLPDARRVTVTTKKLVEVADLDNVLAYKGNYMVFALKENNYITLHMMQDYLDVGDELVLRDPDELRRTTASSELQELATCVKRTPTRSCSRRIREEFKQLLIDRLTSPRKDSELVIVPTTRSTSSASSARIRCSRTSSSSTGRST